VNSVHGLSLEMQQLLLKQAGDYGSEPSSENSS
jgi:hypothetical protein